DASTSSVPQGSTAQFTVTGILSDKTTEDLTNLVAWTSSSASVATVSAAGIATGVSVGSAIVKASIAGFSATAGLAVQPRLVTVTKIVPVQNKRHQVKEIDIFLSDPVNASLAGNTLAYVLKTPGKKNSFTARNARTIKIKSARYVAAPDEVILTPKA